MLTHSHQVDTALATASGPCRSFPSLAVRLVPLVRIVPVVRSVPLVRPVRIVHRVRVDPQYVSLVHTRSRVRADRGYGPVIIGRVSKAGHEESHSSRSVSARRRVRSWFAPVATVLARSDFLYPLVAVYHLICRYELYFSTPSSVTWMIDDGTNAGWISLRSGEVADISLSIGSTIIRIVSSVDGPLQLNVTRQADTSLLRVMPSPLGDTIIGSPRWCHRVECNLGRLITDAMLHSCPDCDIAHINSGALRANLPFGPIELSPIVSVLPFRNRLMTYSMKGEDFIRNVIDYGIQQPKTKMANSICIFKCNSWQCDHR
jgi:hypothetical protein